MDDNQTVPMNILEVVPFETLSFSPQFSAADRDDVLGHVYITGGAIEGKSFNLRAIFFLGRRG